MTVESDLHIVSKLRNTTADDRSDPPIPRWDESMRAKR